MRDYHEQVAADVRPTTAGSDTLLGFMWRGQHYRIVRWLGVWLRGETLYQHVATASSEQFVLHAEEAGRWILDEGLE